MPLVFSYGTLQQPNVQRDTFGRLLEGSPDELPGYRLSMLRIGNREVVATSGATHHPIAGFSGNPADRIPGTVFEITDEELASADRYEIPAYRRVLVDLASGTRAWVYVDARRPAGDRATGSGPGGGRGRPALAPGASRPDRDVEKAYPKADFVAKLRRLADAIENGKRFEIRIAGERIRVPARAILNVEHERTGREEEIEFQIKWSAGG